MFGKHALAARILQEAKDQGIELVTIKPMTETEYEGAKELLADMGRKTTREELIDMSVTNVDKLTPMQRSEYRNRQEALGRAAEKMARDAEAIECALAHFRKFDLTTGQQAALKYISSMMPRHYEVSTDGKVIDHATHTRYGMAKRLYIAIEDLKTGYSSARPVDVIDGMICIPSSHPRWIKGAFEFQLKQHLDYELRFKKRDQEHYNAIFAKQ